MGFGKHWPLLKLEFVTGVSPAQFRKGPCSRVWRSIRDGLVDRWIGLCWGGFFFFLERIRFGVRLILLGIPWHILSWCVMETWEMA